MSTLRIAQLYPDVLGVTGDRGNVEVLATRARLAGIDADVLPVGIGDASPDDVDIVVIGNGPLSAMRTVRADLEARAAWIRAARDGGAVVLAVGGGAELLATRLDLLEGGHLDGIGLVAARVERTRDRRVGYVVAETPDGRIVGFEDHASLWHADDAAGVYGRVRAGSGSVSPDGETLRDGTVFVSNVQGPLLPLNPWFADVLLGIALERRGITYASTTAHAEVDAHAAAARAEIERLAVTKRFNAIQL